VHLDHKVLQVHVVREVEKVHRVHKDFVELTELQDHQECLVQLENQDHPVSQAHQEIKEIWVLKVQKVQ
jgi:hypothetical protein